MGWHREQRIVQWCSRCRPGISGRRAVTHPNLDHETAVDYCAYDDIARQIFPRPARKGGFTQLDQIDPEYVATARRAADRLDLPWPPDLGTSDDFVLSHGPQLKFLLDTLPGTDTQEKP